MYSHATPIAFAPASMDYVPSEFYSDPGIVYYSVTEPAYDPNAASALEYCPAPENECYSYPDIQYYPVTEPAYDPNPDPALEYYSDPEIESYSNSVPDIQYYSDVDYHPDQMPECCSDLAPEFYSDPAPQYYHDSGPEYFSDPVPAYYPVPVPTYYPAPAPIFTDPCYQPPPVACSSEPSSSVSYSPTPSNSSCSTDRSQAVNRQREASDFDFDFDLNMMTLAHGGTLATRVYKERMQHYHKQKWATGSCEYDQKMLDLNRERNLHLDDNVLDLHYLPLALALNELDDRIEQLRAGQRVRELFVCTGKGNNSRAGSLTIKEVVLMRAAAAGIPCSVAPQNEGWLIISLQSHY